jgi:hypothetical protein
MSTTTALAPRPALAPLPAELSVRIVRPSPTPVQAPHVAPGYSGLVGLLEPVLMILSAGLVSLVIASVAAGIFRA